MTNPSIIFFLFLFFVWLCSFSSKPFSGHLVAGQLTN
uniref:Uncharacterized protein n=1 Tax=Rhizophora mucronata TaxID=61149 RepID=A0A2P2L8Q0_RHIMU